VYNHRETLVQPFGASTRSRRLLRFQVYRIQQQSEAPTLALNLILRQGVRLRAQAVDDDLAFGRQIDWIDDTADRPRGIFLAPFPVMVIEEAVSPDVSQPMYPVGAPTGEIVFVVATAFQPRNVRFAELHLRFLATFLAMRAAH